MQKTIKTPALIDRHIHGGYGVDFNNCSEEDIVFLCQKLVAHGIGAIYPTIMTDDEEKIRKQIQIIKNAKNKLKPNSAKIYGIHLEGPFINPEKRGIHPADKILKPSVENFKKLVPESLWPEIKIVSLAPELDENLELTKFLEKIGITVLAGHTNSLGDELSQIKQITHFFNAMPSIHHREQNITSKALTDDSVSLEIIADGVHIAPLILKMIFKIKPKDKIILISDAIPIAYYDKGSLSFAGEEISIKNGRASNKQGTIAGASLYLDDVIRFLAINNIASFEDAVAFATKNVQASLDIPQNEDYVIWGEDFSIKSVYIKS